MMGLVDPFGGFVGQQAEGYVPVADGITPSLVSY